MYAVIESGGKQHRVQEGEILRLEKLSGQAGDKVTFDKVLMMGEGDSAKVGAPYVDVAVEAEVIEQGRGDKIKIIKFRRRKHHRKQMGHRQDYTAVKIISIQEVKKASRVKPAKETPAKTEDVTAKPDAKKASENKTAKKPAVKKATTTENKTAAKKTASGKTETAAKKPATRKTTTKKPAAKKETGSE